MSLFQELGAGEEWMQWASCAEVDPEAFFPEPGWSSGDAKRVCWGCAVREECLDFAQRTGETHGILGGLSPQERRRMKGES